MPCTEISGSPGMPKPNDALPPLEGRVPRRITVPLAQRNPSPNVAPAPLLVACAPWKNVGACPAGGVLLSCRSTVSFVTRATPFATSLPASPNELRQPDCAPTALELPHGHAVPLPSPKQNGWIAQCTSKIASAAPVFEA